MAWTTPAAATTGATLTKSWLDTYVTDNMVDVGQPGIAFAAMVSTQVWNSVGSEAYATRIALDTLTISKNTSLSSNALVFSVGGITRADRKSTRLNSSHALLSRMPSSA